MFFVHNSVQWLNVALTRVAINLHSISFDCCAWTNSFAMSIRAFLWGAAGSWMACYKTGKVCLAAGNPRLCDLVWLEYKVINYIV